MKISILFSFLTFACAILSFAQSDCITFISGEDITTITDDTEYIWLGTTENGLVRMDKSTQEKVYFDTGNSNLPVNDIQSVMIFENQTFTGTEDEISVLQGEDFYTFSNEVGGLSLDLDNGEIAVVDNSEFRIFDAAGNTLYTKDLFEVMPNQCCPHITDIEQDADGNIWLSHWDFYQYAVMMYDGEEWTAFNSQNSILPIESPGNNNMTVVGNTVFVSNWSGLYEYSEEEWTVFHNSDMSTVQNETDDIVGYSNLLVENDSEGIFWVGASHYEEGFITKIAYQTNDEWKFLDLGENEIGEITTIVESRTNSDTIYVGMTQGLMIIDKSCLEIISGNQNEVIGESIAIFPNPTKNEIMIQSEEHFEYSLMDNLGRIVQVGFSENGTSISLRNLPYGLYYLTLKNERIQYSERIVKIETD